MEKKAPRYFTPEEYLVMESAAEFKSEYYQGEMFALAGGSVNHNRIVGNLFGKLNQKFFNGPCEVFTSDMRVWIEAKQAFTYPDISVVCGKLELYPDRDDTILNPVVIIEVLSESTEGFDRGRKFEMYRALPSLREYILIDQYKIHVEQFSVGEGGKWVLTEYNQESDVLRFSSIDFQIPVQEIYHRVEFPSRSG